MVPDPEGMGSSPQPLFAGGPLAPAAPAFGAGGGAAPIIPLGPTGGVTAGCPVPGAPTPACPMAGGGMGLPIETAPARPPEVGAPEPSVAAAPPVTDGEVTGGRTVGPVMPASSPLHAHRIQPNATTIHRVARLAVFDLAIAHVFPGTASFFGGRSKEDPALGNAQGAKASGAFSASPSRPSHHPDRDCRPARCTA